MVSSMEREMQRLALLSEELQQTGSVLKKPSYQLLLPYDHYEMELNQTLSKMNAGEMVRVSSNGERRGILRRIVSTLLVASLGWMAACYTYGVPILP